MRKYALGVVLLIVVLLVSGQEGCQTGGETVGTGPYVGGNDGLSIVFLEDAPPASGNFQGESIPLEVELTNNGEKEIATGSAYIKLIGAITSNSFTTTKTTATNTGAISAIRDASDVSDNDFVNLGTATLNDAIGASWSPLIKAQLCYPYETNIQIDNLCVPGDNRETGTKECEIDSAKNLVAKGDVSAAPVQVTSIVESRASDGIRITMDIENQGNGYVLDPSKTCDSVTGVVDREDYVVVVNIPGDVWTCNYKDAAAKTVELRDNSGRLRCSKSIGGTGRAYNDRFVATLSYKYVDTVSKSIVIETNSN
ncbi:MAG: hypothetical protein KKG75_00700 [Nanoarchaeota archaeon]|nr:hypothetical protein [Nanoarchaeota archaeon]